MLRKCREEVDIAYSIWDLTSATWDEGRRDYGGDKDLSVIG